MEERDNEHKQPKIDQRLNAFANKSKKNRLIAFGIIVAVILGLYAARYFIEHAANSAVNNQLNQSTYSQTNP